MWQRFTERARRVVFYAQEEAQKFGEGYVSTEHLLLGLVRESDTVAARVLEALGVELSRVRVEVEKQLPSGDARPNQDMTLTPRAKRVIDLAYDEARNLGNNYIGTEHLLLGLIREGDGVAGRVLKALGVEVEKARRIVMTIQEAQPQGQTSPGSALPENPVPVTPNGVTPPPDPLAGLDLIARRSFFFAEREAMRRGQVFLSPEHLLLGLLREPETTAARALVATGINLDSLRAAAVSRCRDSGTSIKGEAVMSAAVIQAVRIASQEQAASQTEKVGTEHLLLGLLREPDGVAGRVLEEFGVEAEGLRAAIRELDAEG